MMDSAITRYQGVEKQSAGYRLLTGMGWKEGEGLGATKQGIKEHIRVKKKFENWGVGAVESHDRTRDWSNGMNEFHRVLSTLSEITSKHAGSSGNEEDEDKEEDIQKMDRKKKKSKKGKKEKSKKDKLGKRARKKEDEVGEGDKTQKKKKNYSGIDLSSADDDTPHEEPMQPRKIARHIGRFKKRETAKMVKGYSSNDLAAILGEDPFAKNQELSVTTADTVGDGAENIVSSEEEGKTEGLVIERGMDDGVDHQEEHDNRDDDSWWSNYFIKGPRAGSERIQKAKRSVGFSERDQEALYTSAHDGATQGRVGLGRSSMPKKVGGVRWAGKKTKLDSEDEDDHDDTAMGTMDGTTEVEEEGATGIQVILPPQKNKEAQQKKEATTPLIETMAISLLEKENSKSMKVKALVKSLIRKQRRKGMSDLDSSAITSFLKQSSKLVLEGKVVKMA